MSRRNRQPRPGQYTIRRLPESARRRCRGTTQEWALFDPDCLFVASSWTPTGLRQRRDELQSAYDSGYAAGRFARRGRPAKLDPVGESHRQMVEGLDLWEGGEW